MEYHDMLILLLMLVVSSSALSTKKGLGVSPENYRCHDLDHFTHIHWWYDWSLTTDYMKTKRHCSHVKSGHVPMVWGKWFDAHTFQSLPSDTHTILGFNEPNHRDQANLSPQEAANAWRNLEKYNPGKTLVSPSAAKCGGNCNSGDAKHWFTEFFKHCQGCRVDYLATHAYWCNAHTTMNFLRDLWTTFHKPIWLTEFSCPNTHSPDTQLQYMKELLPQLESAHFIHRYFWFAHRWNGSWITSSASLLEQNSNQLTELGKYYNNF